VKERKKELKKEQSIKFYRIKVFKHFKKNLFLYALTFFTIVTEIKEMQMNAFS